MAKRLAQAIPRLLALSLALASLAAQVPIGGPPSPPKDNQAAQAPPAVETLKEEVRQLRDQLQELRQQTSAITDHLTFGPEAEIQPEDYATARSRFSTKLLRKGPSPQAASPLTLPAGVSELEYPSGELRLKAWVSRPSEAGGRRPAVLYLHGGFAFGTGDWNQTKQYRDAGFVVMAPMLRGENGLPGAFSYFYDEVDDVVAAAEYLSRQPYVDSSRVFLAGHSIGGVLTILASMATSRFRAAASIDGFPYWGGVFAEDRNLPFDKSNPLEIQMRSAIAYASSFKSPLRMYRSERNPVTAYLRLVSQRTVALAKMHGLDVEEIEIDGDHMSMVDPAVRQSIAFFERISAQPVKPSEGSPSPLPAELDLELGNGVKMHFKRLETGKFQMGSPPTEEGRANDEARHETTIAKSFLMGVNLVTQAQYQQVMGSRPSVFSSRGGRRVAVAGIKTDDLPVENVTWDDATDFARAVSLLPAIRERGWIVELPIEAEWEYACRAGTGTAFAFGNALSSMQANFNGNQPYGAAAKGPSLGRPSAVGSFAPNAWGIFDMHGNVLQWTSDAYDRNYQVSINPAGNRDRVVRGGAFFMSARDTRCAKRFHFEPGARNSATRGVPPISFRIVVRAREE